MNSIIAAKQEIYARAHRYINPPTSLFLATPARQAQHWNGSNPCSRHMPEPVPHHIHR